MILYGNKMLLMMNFFFIILFSIDKSISRFTNRHITNQTCNKSMYISQLMMNSVPGIICAVLLSQ